MAAPFRQVDIERLIRAAMKYNSVVQVDLRTNVATIIPGAAPHWREGTSLEMLRNIANDGPHLENWD